MAEPKTASRPTAEAVSASRASTPPTPQPSPTRRSTATFAADAPRSRMGSVARKQRAARGFHGPTTNPHSTTNAQTGRDIQPDVSTHTPRARGTLAPQAARAGRHGRTPCAASSGPVVACVVWCRVGAHAELVVLRVSAEAISQPMAPPCNACLWEQQCPVVRTHLSLCRMSPPRVLVQPSTHARDPSASTPQRGQARRLPTSAVHAGSCLSTLCGDFDVRDIYPLTCSTP
jgi:hypothetical protein